MILLRAARLFDGVGMADVPNPVVVIEGGRLLGVESGDAVDLAGRHVVDLGDVCLLPGLVDAHQHLVLDASPTPVENLAARDDDAVLEAARRHAATALRAGVTTVRDLGDRGYVLLRLREELRREPTSGPELLVAGPPITTPGGHCWFLGGEAEGEQGLRAAVQEHLDRGVDVVKVMVTGGGITPGSVRHRSQFDLRDLRIIADAAHAGGVPVTGHAQGLQGVSDAVAAGFDGIEHCTFLTSTGYAVDPEVVQALATTGTFVSVTAATKKPLAEAVAADPLLAREMQNMVGGMVELRAAGARMCLSSDAGAVPGGDHDSLPYGVRQLPLIGMAGEEALRAVTSVAAAACNVGHRKGRIAPGYDADLVAVPDDPREDLSVLARPQAVFRAGQRVF